MLVIWATFFKDEGDAASFLCIVYPVLQCWAGGPEMLNLPPAHLSGPVEDDERVPRGMVALTRLQEYNNQHLAPTVDQELVWLDIMQRSFYCLTATLLAFVVNADFVVSGKEQAMALFQSAHECLESLGRTREAQSLRAVVTPKFLQLGGRVGASFGLVGKASTEATASGAAIGATGQGDEMEVDEDDDFEPRKRRATSDSRILATIENVGEDGRRLAAAMKHLNRLPTETEALFVDAAKSISPAVHSAAIDFVANIHDNARANILARCLLSEAEIRGIDSNAFERNFPIPRLHHQNENVTPVVLLQAHALAARRRYAESFESYLKAFELDPSQPQTCLCLGLMLLFFSQHSLVNLKPQVLVKSLACMDQYRCTRLQVSVPRGERVDLNDRPSATSAATLVSQQAIQQEIYYNFGRFFQEAKLFNLAVENYKKALEIADNYPQLMSTPFSLTRDVAFNLTLIYKQSGADNLVLSVMIKYLSF